LSEKIKTIEARMAEVSALKTQILNYSKTRAVYVAYRKAGYSKKFQKEVPLRRVSPLAVQAERASHRPSQRRQVTPFGAGQAESPAFGRAVIGFSSACGNPKKRSGGTRSPPRKGAVGVWGASPTSKKKGAAHGSGRLLFGVVGTTRHCLRLYWKSFSGLGK